MCSTLSDDSLVVRLWYICLVTSRCCWSQIGHLLVEFDIVRYNGIVTLDKSICD